MIANFILLTYSWCFVNVPQVSFDHSQLSFEILHLDRLSKQTQLEAFLLPLNAKILSTHTFKFLQTLIHLAIK